MLEDDVTVPLKRKVRSLETDLLEWRRCACLFTSDSSQLILELTDDDVDDVVLDDDEDEAPADGNENTDHSGGLQRDYAGDRQVDASRRGKCRVAIDLGSALKRIEQKRKNKTRCEIEYWDSIASRSNSSSPMDRRVRTEELMASSARHCQQFIDQVREAERQTKRKQSIRLGAVLAAAAASASGGSSSHKRSQQGSEAKARADRSGSPSQTSPPRVKTEHFRLQRAAVTPITTNASVKSSSGSASSGTGALHASSLNNSGKSEEISPAAAATRAVTQDATASRDYSLNDSFHSSTSSRDQRQCQRQEATEQPNGDQQTQHWSQRCHDDHTRDCESDTLDSSSGVISPRVTPLPVSAPYREPPNGASNLTSNNSYHSLASSQASCSSVSTVSKLLLPSKPLPQELFAQRLASLRTGAQQLQNQQDQQENSDYADDDDDESFDNRRRARMEKLFSPGASSSRHAFQNSRVIGRRRPSIDLRAARERSKSTCLRSSTISRRRNSGSPASAAALAANLNRLRLQSRTSNNNNTNSNGYGGDYRDRDDAAGDSSNRAELHILMRVEAALRQLEKENALAKEREALLSQEVQSLRDALRVKSAEKKHVETQFQQLLREKDEWKQVAQRAECAVVQMEDELLIAREEAQLLQSERVRLKHQNKELLTHVHRLDSLVYGRF